MKKLLAALFLLFLAGFFGPASGAAQGEFPTKRIVCIVPSEAGGDGDVTCRKMLEMVSTRIGQSFVVVNKPGAGGSPGYRDLHASKPDGYTIGYAYPTLFINKMMGLMPWDHNGFTILAQHVIHTPMLVSSVKAAHPFKTVKEVVSYGLAHPGEIKFAMSVVGGSWWFGGMLFEASTKVNFKNIPQEGAAGVVIPQLLGGHADLGLANLTSATGHVDKGNLNFLAYFGKKRSVVGKYNHVPTLIESGYDVSWDSPNFFIAPPNLPKNISEKLSKAILDVASNPEWEKFIISHGGTPLHDDPDQAFKYIEKQKEIVSALLRNAGILKEK